MKSGIIVVSCLLIASLSACSPRSTVTVTVPETQTETAVTTTAITKTTILTATVSATTQVIVTASSTTPPPPIKPTGVTPPDTRTFQRPATDEYVKITDALTLYDPASSPPGTGLNFIPYGSTIIQWHNGITEAFGPGGKRLFIARDAEAAQIPHPSGPNGPFTSPATQIFQVPNGALIGGPSDSPDWSPISLGGTVILFIFKSQSSYPPS